jgi:hypothetical protein
MNNIELLIPIPLRRADGTRYNPRDVLDSAQARPN